MWPTSLSSTACRYSSQKAMTLRFSLVSSTSVFGLYDVAHPARAKRSDAAPRIFLSAALRQTRPTSSSFQRPSRLEPEDARIGKSSPRESRLDARGGHLGRERHERDVSVHRSRRTDRAGHSLRIEMNPRLLEAAVETRVRDEQ